MALQPGTHALLVQTLPEGQLSSVRHSTQAPLPLSQNGFAPPLHDVAVQVPPSVTADASLPPFGTWPLL